MKFSVLTPVYNVEKYIVECIESVINQTYSDFEFILVDDGSPDESPRICDKYAQEDSRIKVIHKENGGLISARRAAIAVASGEYCVFLDSDDYLDREALEVINKKIEETSCDCVCYGFNRVNDQGSVLWRSNDTEEKIVNEKGELYKIIFTNHAFNSLGRKAVRRELLSADFSKYYHVSMGEDLLQSIEILKNSKSVAFTTENLYNYRINLSSITRTVSINNYIDDFTVRASVLDFLRNENVWSESDYQEYKDYSLKLFAIEIMRVAGFDAKRSQKKQIFSKIREQEYYKEFLSTGKYSKKAVGWKHVLVDAFRSGRDNMIINIVLVRKLLSRCYRLFRKG